MGLKFENRNILKKLRGKGCFLYGNHTRDLDAFLPAMAAFPKRAYIVANPDAVSIKGLKHIVMMLGCIPIPTELKAMPKFLSAIKTRDSENSCIGIFPEAHIWPFYTGTRPLKATSFRYPAESGSAAVAMAITYRKRTGLFFWAKRPGMTVTLSEPMYADKEIPLKQAAEQLRDKTYRFFCETILTTDNVEYFHYEPMYSEANEQPLDA